MKINLPVNPVTDDTDPHLMVAPVISTAHTSLETHTRLDDADGFLSRTRDGAIMYVPAYDERTRGEEFEPDENPELEILFRFMAGLGYRFFRLDSDGTELEGLPTYAWE
jgi:hypothetical protein